MIYTEKWETMQMFASLPEEMRRGIAIGFAMAQEGTQASDLTEEENNGEDQ